jgi:hypothetical protein
MNRRGTEPYARWCGRSAGAIPPPTRSTDVKRVSESYGGIVRTEDMLRERVHTSYIAKVSSMRSVFASMTEREPCAMRYGIPARWTLSLSTGRFGPMLRTRPRTSADSWNTPDCFASSGRPRAWWGCGCSGQRVPVCARQAEKQGPTFRDGLPTSAAVALPGGVLEEARSVAVQGAPCAQRGTTALPELAQCRGGYEPYG